jgi:nickel/cobalt exporter
MISQRETMKSLVSLAAILVFVGTIDAALAQSYPFSTPKGAQIPTPSGSALVSIFPTQSEYHRQFSELVRAAGADDRIVWGLIGLSFLYGVFQAAGPEYSKAVLSSYLGVSTDTWRRGLALAFGSALFEATLAVAAVALFSALLRLLATTMGVAVDLIAVVSYALIVLIGLRLSWIKGRDFFTMLRQVSPTEFDVGAALIPPLDHDRDYGGVATHHAHTLESVEFAAPNGTSVAFAAWLPSCPSAIVVLIFALAQGLFWVGVAATFMIGAGSALTTAVIATIAVIDRARAARFANARSQYGALAMRGIELGAAIATVAFGALLLTGCIV